MLAFSLGSKFSKICSDIPNPARKIKKIFIASHTDEENEAQIG